MSDAAFREALDVYDKARDYLRGLKPHGLVGHQLWAERQVEEARARVLALYAERQGEVYEVRLDQAGDPVALLDRTYNPGDRVRVVRCEVGMYDPKNDPPTGGAK